MGLICKTALVLQVVLLVLIGVQDQVQGELFPEHLWGRIQKFVLVEQNNFDAFLIAAGVPETIRQKEAKSKAILEISESGNRGKLRVMGFSRETEINFVFGEEFEEENVDGRHCQSVVNRVESSWIHKKNCEGSKIEIVREFKGDQLINTYKAGSTTATQIFKKE